MSDFCCAIFFSNKIDEVGKVSKIDEIDEIDKNLKLYT